MVSCSLVIPIIPGLGFCLFESGSHPSLGLLPFLILLQIPQLLTKSRKLERHPCHMCGLNPLGIFFYYDEIRQASNLGLIGAQLQLKCMACRLAEVLNNESDHYKLEKRVIIKEWLRDEYDEDAWNDNNMPKALEDFYARDVVEKAKKLDLRRWRKTKLRHKLFRRDPAVHWQYAQWDREFEERQIPLRECEKTRLGWKNRSPTVESKDPVSDEWNNFDDSRVFAHGR